MEELDDQYTTVKVEPAMLSSVSSPSLGKPKNLKKSPLRKSTNTKREPVQLSPVQQTCPERSQNSESYYDRSGDYYYSLSSTPKKDSFDLFFDSISATVKNLPPKLAAEVKSKVSQVIAEFELRAICEKEAQEKAKQSATSVPAQLTSVVNVDISDRTANEQHVVDEVSHYVYTYPQKIHN